MSRATFFRLHSWLGIITGAFLLVIAWTGSIVVFKDEIDWLFTPAVRADPARGVRPLDEIVAAARGRYPDRRITVSLPVGRHWTYTAYVYGEPETRYLYIDAATARVTQDDAMRGYTWNAGYFLRQLHVRLLMGYWGRVFVGVFGVTLVASVITSLWIYRDWLRSLVRVRRRAGRRIWHMDLHKAVGLWALAFNLLFGVTGAVLGLENLYRKLVPAAPASRVTAGGAAPSVSTPVMGSRAARTEGNESRGTPRLPPGLTAGGVVAALGLLDREFKPASVDLPARGATIVVRGDHPGALIAKEASAYTIERDTGRVSGATDARRAAWGRYLYNLLDPLHFGYFGERWGLVTGYLAKGLWALAGLTPGVLSITGGYMWLLRRRRARASAAARRAYAGEASPSAGAMNTIPPAPAGRR